MRWLGVRCSPEQGTQIVGNKARSCEIARPPNCAKTSFGMLYVPGHTHASVVLSEWSVRFGNHAITRHASHKAPAALRPEHCGTNTEPTALLDRCVQFA